MEDFDEDIIYKKINEIIEELDLFRILIVFATLGLVFFMIVTVLTMMYIVNKIS